MKPLFDYMVRRVAILCVLAAWPILAAGNGGVYVPLDSWIYPVLYRLAGLGFIPDQFSNMAPWTRAECIRQVNEAERIAGREPVLNTLAEKMIADLHAELNDKQFEGGGARVESLYTSMTGIAGTSLGDGDHFGQTVVNNYGRPYGNGANNVTGISAYAESHNFFVYIRGESQYAASQPSYNLATRQYIAVEDSNPLQPAATGRAFARIEPEELYAGVQVGVENISFGRENLWWGPGQNSAFAFSDNADPFVMLNFNQTKPIVLPWVFKYLGQMRTQFIFGELSGHQFPRKPQVNAQKVSFDITKDLEVGIERSAFWGGAGHPITLTSFKNSLFSTNSVGCSFAYGDTCDPGDRHTGFDIRWRAGPMRKYLTLYTDSYADDEVNPLSNPGRSAWAPGVYVSQLPHLKGWDVRFETYATWLNQARNGQFFYYNNQYHDAYTNDGSLLGSYVGRQARAYVGTVGYWLSGRTRFEAQVRQTDSPTTFLPGGGSQTDGLLRAQWGITPQFLVNLQAQVEHYNIPVLGPAEKDTLASFSFVYSPKNWATH